MVENHHGSRSRGTNRLGLDWSKLYIVDLDSIEIRSYTYREDRSVRVLSEVLPHFKTYNGVGGRGKGDYCFMTRGAVLYIRMT